MSFFKVKYWLTLNEPAWFCEMFQQGFFPSSDGFLSNEDNNKCLKNMMIAHAKAHDIYTNKYKASQNGESRFRRHVHYTTYSKVKVITLSGRYGRLRYWSYIRQSSRPIVTGGHRGRKCEERSVGYRPQRGPFSIRRLFGLSQRGQKHFPHR